MIMLVISLPAPRISTLLRLLRPLIFIVFFFPETTIRWIRFDRDEMSGMTASLSALPEKNSLPGLYFVKYSRYVHGRPFLQDFACAPGKKRYAGAVTFTINDQIMPAPGQQLSSLPHFMHPAIR